MLWNKTPKAIRFISLDPQETVEAKKVPHFYEPAAFPEIIFEKFYCDKNLQVSKRRKETFNVKTIFVLDEAGYFETFLLDPDNSFLLKTK